MRRVAGKVARRLAIVALIASLGGAATGDAVRKPEAPGGGTAAQNKDGAEVKDLSGILEPIRTEHGLPALGAAVVTGKGLEAIGVVGVRKAGTDLAATAEDQWHLGSDTKAMTAFLIAALIEGGSSNGRRRSARCSRRSPPRPRPRSSGRSRSASFFRTTAGFRPTPPGG